MHAALPRWEYDLLISWHQGWMINWNVEIIIGCGV